MGQSSWISSHLWLQRYKAHTRLHKKSREWICKNIDIWLTDQLLFTRCHHQIRRQGLNSGKHLFTPEHQDESEFVGCNKICSTRSRSKFAKYLYDSPVSAILEVSYNFCYYHKIIVLRTHTQMVTVHECVLWPIAHNIHTQCQTLPHTVITCTDAE